MGKTFSSPIEPLFQIFSYIPYHGHGKEIALIIDCDNAKADAIYGIMEELSKFGDC